ncbi:MAG TPA: tetratricopeptide repeat protein, partial [Nannocystaceae bacterium]|nr:tetratricopeptide repeat protein [Nannocystaceae bacterium]
RIATGELERPRERNRAPSWVLAVLERGMAVEPDDRFVDMNALLAALGGPPKRRRLVPVLAFGGALAIVAAVLAQDETPPDACAGEPPSLRWPGEQAEIAKRVLALQDEAANEAWLHLDGRITDRVRTWSSTHEAVCEAAATDRVEADLARRDRELACLTDAATSVDDLLAEIAEPTVVALTRGAEVVQRLPDPERCVGVPPTVVAPPPPEIAGDVDALRAELHRAHLRMRLGRVHEGRALTEVVVVRAQQLDYAPLLAEALILRARTRMVLGLLAEAEADARAASEEARRSDHERGLAHAASVLAEIAAETGDLEQALRWTTEARAHLQRPADDALLLIALIDREATIRAQRDERDAAQALLMQAETVAAELGLGDEAIASVEHARGDVAVLAGDYGDAIAHYERAREAFTRVVGSNGYRVAHLWHQIAGTYVEAGNYLEARNAYVRAIEIYDRIGDLAIAQRVGLALGVAACEDMLGDGEGALRRLAEVEPLVQLLADPRVSSGFYETRGVILIGLGRGVEALDALETALGDFHELYGEAHADLRQLLANLALAAREAGRSELAETYLQRALLIQSTLAQPDMQGAELLHAYGFLLLERGQLDAAAAQFERSGNITEELVGIDAPDMGWIELGRGRIALERGNHALARLSLERAEALWSGDSIPPEDRADMQRDLAVALWETGDRARALAVARAAAEVRPDDEVLQAWLAAHPGK